jgi:hypothetical protein
MGSRFGRALFLKGLLSLIPKIFSCIPDRCNLLLWWMHGRDLWDRVSWQNKSTKGTKSLIHSWVRVLTLTHHKGVNAHSS